MCVRPGLRRWLQLFYRATARELRRLEAQGLSPLYSLFGEAAAGAATVRAAAAQRLFMKVRRAGPLLDRLSVIIVIIMLLI